MCSSERDRTSSGSGIWLAATRCDLASAANSRPVTCLRYSLYMYAAAMGGGELDESEEEAGVRRRRLRLSLAGREEVYLPKVVVGNEGAV